MKKTSFFILMATLLLCNSCHNNPVDIFTGDYTYKTSGSVDITMDSSYFTVNLQQHIGQMDIIELPDNDSTVVVIMSQLNGDVVRFNAHVTSDSIFFEPYTRRLSLYVNDTINGSYDITINGRGVKNDYTISINEVYDGIIKTDNSSGTIYGDDILTVAKRN